MSDNTSEHRGVTHDAVTAAAPLQESAGQCEGCGRALTVATAYTARVTLSSGRTVAMTYCAECHPRGGT